VTWFKVDDKLHDHRKARKAGKSAMGVWVLAGSWSMDNETDGFIPEDVLARWGTPTDARRLVAAGLWDNGIHNEETGWWFHDWSVFQPSAAVTAAKKAKEHEAGILGNHKRWHVKRKINDPDCEYCHRPPDREPDLVPDRVRSGGGESGANRPVPVPEPDYSVGDDKSPAQVLIAEWLDRCSSRPPGRVIGQVAKELKTMLDEGIPVETVRVGLANWHRKNLHPATLASVVNESIQAGPRVDAQGRVLLPPLPKGFFDQ
jgi:hypothetical protein